MSEQRFSRPFASRHAPLFSESIGAQCVSSFKSIKEKKKKKKKKGKDDFTYLENFVSNWWKDTLIIINAVVLPDLREMRLVRSVKNTEGDFHHLHIWQRRRIRKRERKRKKKRKRVQRSCQTGLKSKEKKNGAITLGSSDGLDLPGTGPDVEDDGPLEPGHEEVGSLANDILLHSAHTVEDHSPLTSLNYQKIK